MIKRKKVKLDVALPSPHLSHAGAEKMAQAFALLGNAFLGASEILMGKAGRPAAPAATLMLTNGAHGCPVTVNELVNEFLLAKARAGRSDRYLRQVRITLSNFNRGRGRIPLDQLTVHDVEKWTHNTQWSVRTVRNYVADVRTMLNYAVKRGYLGRNPAAAVELPPLDSNEAIHIHTPDQVRTVLEYTRKANLDVCRRLAVRYFAGVRSAEANRLTEENLKLELGLLEVPAFKSKTRARRLVTIQPNLRSWLELGGELRGLADMTVRNVARGSGVEWAHNVTRHSFVSYHLAKFQNAGKTALEAGHSEQMLFKHYRALVTPAAADEFWNIVPA